MPGLCLYTVATGLKCWLMGSVYIKDKRMQVQNSCTQQHHACVPNREAGRWCRSHTLVINTSVHAAFCALKSDELVSGRVADGPGYPVHETPTVRQGCTWGGDDMQSRCSLKMRPSWCLKHNLPWTSVLFLYLILKLLCVSVFLFCSIANIVVSWA